MSAHTPGPWQQENDEGRWIMDSRQHWVALGCGDTDTEAAANARLIAAAPEMYQELSDTDDALSKLIRDLEPYVPAADMLIIHNWQASVRAALSKARGAQS